MDVPLEAILAEQCWDEGPLLVDFCRCQHCGEVHLTIVAQARGFEHTYCQSCGDMACDQLELPE